MFPMAFEEFCWALGDTNIIPFIKTFYEKQIPLGVAHRTKQRNLRLYMLIGGMTQTVN